MSEKERSRAKFAARQAEQRAKQATQSPRRTRRTTRPKQASREEQQARLLDCGWQNWDDR